MSLTPRLEIMRRIAGRSAVLAAVALALGACDLGGRDRAPLPDAGPDGGPDAGGGDAGPADAGEDAGFRDGDAGAWEDDPVAVTEPCNNDCEYTYNMTMYEFPDIYTSDLRGKASFRFTPGESEEIVDVTELHKTLFILSGGWSATYRQRAIQNLVLEAASHDLISGDALVYNAYSGVTTLKRYEFSYDSAAGELAYTVESGGRTWGRTIAAPDPPIVMLNHREYPIETRGFHSPLTALLLGERYDWDLGGVQRVPIFSPELERIDAVELEADGADTLVMRFPIDSAKPPWHSQYVDGAVYETNDVPIRFEYGVPVHMNSRDHFEWTAVYVPFLELSLPGPPTDPTSVSFPTVPAGSAAITATSGDATLHGLVDAPADAGPHAAVVMIPGWEYATARGEVGAVDLYAQLAQRFVAAGAVAARFDARGAGDNGEAFSEATIDDLAADAAAAVEAVQARADVDPARVFLLTTGAGAHVAAAAAELVDAALAGIVLVAPIGRAYADAVEPLNARYLGSARAEGDYVSSRLSALEDVFDALDDGSYDGEAYQGHTVAAWQSLLDLDLVASPLALPPTLILYGAEDHLVPQELVDELATALDGAGTDATTAILPGLTHALTPGTADRLWPEHGGAEAVDGAASTATTDWLAAIAGGL